MPRTQPLRTHRLCAAVALALGSLLSVSAVQAAAVVPLSSLDGSNGFRADGALGDRTGRTASNAGDINGDGIDDLIIGASDASPNGVAYAGSSYVVFGRSTGSFDAAISLSTLDGSNGFRLDGVAEFDFSGDAVSAAGDINGDGIDDLIIGAASADPNGMSNAGSSYVLFGRSTSGFASAINLSTLDGSNGFRLDGVATGDNSGVAVSTAGDVNGDGIDDLIIGAFTADPNGYASGSSYVVFGRSTGSFDAAINLSTLDGSNGFRLDGVEAGELSGRPVSAAGDINGDGIDDLIIGTNFASPNGVKDAGSSYVVFGSTGSFDAAINLSSLDGSNGFRVDGAAEYDGSGRAVSGAGDINGDGIDDLIIGAAGADLNGIIDAGSTYVVFGRSTSSFGSTFSLSTLDGSNGFRIDGVVTSSSSGGSVSAAGDINGDGIDDLILGAHYRPYSGMSYVVFGSANGFAASIPVSSLDGSTGVRFDGAAEFDQSGFVVSSAGDVNGDGIDDLIIGARYGDGANGYSGGTSHVVFGNAAPLLAAGASRVIMGLEDDSTSSGSTLASLAQDAYLDADPFAGAALDIDAPLSADGVWQYRLDADSPWDPLPTGLSSSNALLLSPLAGLRFLPAADFFGDIEALSLRLWDGADIALYSFGSGQDIRQSIGSLGGFSNDANRLPVAAAILPINDAPAFEASNPPAVLEDAGLQTVAGWAANFSPGPANESDQQVLAYLVSDASNPALFQLAPTVGLSGSLSYTLAADANGSSTFSVAVQDNGGTDNGGVDTSTSQTFTITVLAVNDAPSFSASNPPSVLEGAGAQTVVGWASNFIPGPADESGQQLLAYSVSAISNPALFATAPTVALDGSLSYTLGAGANGSSTFSVAVQDDGGTDNGGIDTSPAQSFTLTVRTLVVFKDGFEGGVTR